MLDKRRILLARSWWASAPSVPGTPGEPPVDPQNNAPVVANAIPDQNGTEGTLFNFAFAANTFSDADLDTLTYTATLSNGSALPAWLTFTPATRTFSGTPPSEITLSIKVTADDGQGGTVSDTFGLVVAAVNSSPVVANPIPDQNGTEGVAFNFAFAANTFSDADLDTLTYTATLANGSALPAWLTFTAATRTFSGTPPSETTLSIKVTADDGQGGTVSDTFGLVVAAVNNSPVVANPIPDQNGTEGIAFNFTFAVDTFSDADLDTLTYSATLAGGTALPAWLTFTPSTRTFSGTPPAETTLSIEVTADDGLGGSVSDTFGLVIAAASADVPTISSGDGDLFTASYVPLTNERNKPPVIEDVYITASPSVAVGSTLTANVVGELNGPFSIGSTEYQWYRATTLVEPVLTAIPGATNQTYNPTDSDYTQYLTVRARLVQTAGSNNTSEYMYSESTVAVAEGTPVSDGDINHLWDDFFDIENGTSVPANWNDVGVAPALVNLGEGADWATSSSSKPLYDNVNGMMVFDGAHRVTGYSVGFPPVYEVWIKARFTGGRGVLFSQGGESIFASDISNNWIGEGLAPQTGDLNEHIFRLVYNGANSIFQVDGGTEVIFDETSSVGSVLNLGCNNFGGDFGEFELKRFQRTAHGVVLTAQEVIDKWAYHGFDVGGGAGGGPSDITYAWEDFLDIESGASVPADWNDALVNPVLTNFGTAANWTAVDASKPTFTVDRLVFSGAHRVEGHAQTHPPVTEIWIKGKFTANNGAMIGWGGQTLFGMNTATEYFVRDSAAVVVAGDLNEHVFRIVLNGASSILQIDGGAEVPFTQNFTNAQFLALGQTYGGSNLADCEIKRFQKTPDGSLLSAQEVADKWLYHGF